MMSTQAEIQDQPKPRRRGRRSTRIRLASLIYALAFFIIFQLSISAFVNLGSVYHYRINYNMFLNNQNTIEVVIDEISKTIQDQKLNNYIILIGNSVAWGTNESSNHSLGYYLNNQSPDPDQVIFNLSAPSIQAGDVYTLLLMLEEQGIQTDRLIIGLSYSAFNERNPGPKAVFWLADYLREVDPVAFSKVYPHLLANNYTFKTGYKQLEENLLEDGFNLLPAYKYKDVIPAYAKLKFNGTDLLGDPRPWYEKSFSDKTLTDPQYLNSFNPEPFNMNESNWGVYFLNRIVEHQEGKQMLVFLNGANGELSTKEINQPGYQSNLQLIEQYFHRKQVVYMNMQDAIEPQYFTDHVHLTKQGNKQLANLLWQRWNSEAINDAF